MDKVLTFEVNNNGSNPLERRGYNLMEKCLIDNQAIMVRFDLILKEKKMARVGGKKMKNIIILIIMTTLIVFLLLFVNIILGDNKPNINKLSPYECGLIPLGDCRASLNIQYILVAILFIIFDIEVIVLLPYAVTINNMYTYWIMIIFLIILTIGFYYEISKGALKYVSMGD